MTLALAILTGLLVAATVWMAWHTRNAVLASLAAVEAAQRQAEEATRARVDSGAPRVTVLIQDPEWPPSLASASNHLGAKPDQINGDVQFVLPRDGSKQLVLVSSGLVRNDGSSTAIVGLNGGATFEDPFKLNRIPASVEVLPVGQGRLALPPGSAVRFSFIEGHTIADWATAWTQRDQDPSSTPSTSLVHLEVIAHDTFDVGVADNTLVQLQAYPLEPVAGDLSRWRLNSEERPYGSVVYGTRRRYFTSRTNNTLLNSTPIADDAREAER